MTDSKNQSPEPNEEKVCYGIIGNIPKEFHSADLRTMFANFINGETGGFKCFHFRHRPEFRQDKASTVDDKETLVSATTCCVILILKEKLQELIKCYHGKNWVDRKGKYFPSKAIISKIRIKAGEDPTEDHPYKTRQEKRDQYFTRTNLGFSQHDLRDLPELHPPPLMPNGNVGTPLSKFMELIRTCKLPPHVIKKLDLNFSLGKSKKKYSNVPLDYKSLEKRGSVSTATTDTGDKRETVSDIVKDLVQDELQTKKASSSTSSSETLWADSFSQVGKAIDFENEEVTTDNTSENEAHNDVDDDNNIRININDDEEDVAEEWDRHNSLHNDVTSQERTKERLFEEDIELKWEKGGSGLVFYTDAAFWKQQEQADFDEETADDWDVDMEIYENPGGGDKDSRDLLQMRLEEQWRKGNDITLSKIGGFEKHTKGFGSQLMKNQGWREGGSLGSSQVGIKEPVIAVGQFPKCKRGLGYYGEKLQRHVKRPRAERNVIISTIYDEPDNQEVNLFESWGPDKLKYISNVEFVRGKTT